MSKYLIIQTGFLGDAVLASGMLRAISAAEPDTKISLLVRTDVAPLFENHPALWKVYGLDKNDKSSAAYINEQLREGEYSVAFIPHRSIRSARIARNAGIPRRIGFRQSEGVLWLTDRVDYTIVLHETERNASLLKAGNVDMSTNEIHSWLVPQQSALERVQGIASSLERRPFVVIAPGSAWATKRWTPEGYAMVARQHSVAGTSVLLIGSEGERRLCTAIADEADMPEKDNLAGVLSLPEVLALISLSKRVYTNDSAPLHLAESVGVPVTAIFGPTVPQFGFGPRLPESSVIELGPLPCRPCRIHGSERCPIGTHECMTRIGAKDVLDASTISQMVL